MSILSHALSQKQLMMIPTITPTTSPKGIAAIVGVGPKLGFSIARKFAHEGYPVAILAQDFNRLSNIADEIARHEEGCLVYAVRIDCSDSASVQEAFQFVLSLGFVEILVYNACQLPLSWQCHPTQITDIRIDSFKKSLAVSTVGALQCAQQVIPGMVEKRKGTILFTGCTSSTIGIPGFAELCCGKYALRALTQCMTKEFQHLGIHVAHVIIDGIVGLGSRSSSSLSKTGQYYSSSSSSTVGGDADDEEVINRSGAIEDLLDPDTLAQTYWQLHAQDPGVWTQEIDLRSSCNN